jgi:ankyrin repeat protein
LYVFSAAHCAARRGSMECLQCLRDFGANLWLSNTTGDLPIHEAACRKHTGLLTYFIDFHFYPIGRSALIPSSLIIYQSVIRTFYTFNDSCHTHLRLSCMNSVVFSAGVLICLLARSDILVVIMLSYATEAKQCVVPLTI